MLFNSYLFLFGFLPVALIVFYGVARITRHGAALSLTLLSFAFYAWWRPSNVLLLAGSIVFNFLVGGRIQFAYARRQTRSVKAWLLLGLLVDLGLLGYFKYANFFIDNLNVLTRHDFVLTRIALPLAISFFTFQKIAYLVDSARGEAKPMSLLEFTLFATFFPQLIAGPIVHYSEVVPQLKSPAFGQLQPLNLLVGIAIFAIGLFKKSVLADTFGSYADPMFHLAAEGSRLDLVTSWSAGIAYTLQLYFDFSGYSDMAIGLARMFGVLLPLNFHSPLRAASIIDYWRRWHMTLQRFIVSYVFQPLSLPFNRSAAQRGLKDWSLFGMAVGVPTFISFTLIGVWHGAGWTYAWFGVLQACYIITNEAWRQRTKNVNRRLRRQGLKPSGPSALTVACYHALTLLAVLFANTLFRSESISTAFRLWTAMVGGSGVAVASSLTPLHPLGLLLMCVLGIAIVGLMPNTQQIMGRYRPALNWPQWTDVAPALLRWTWRPSPAGLVFIGLLLFFGVEFIQRGQAVFLYFNF